MGAGICAFIVGKLHFLNCIFLSVKMQFRRFLCVSPREKHLTERFGFERR